MRFRLEYRFQKEFLYSLKGEKTWQNLADKLQTTSGILKGCCIEGNTIPEELYQKIRTPETDQHILDILDNQWGRRRGGFTSDGNTKSICIPRLSDDLAEVIGVMLGDGSIYINKKKGIYQIRIAGNVYKEQEYFLYLYSLFKKLFGITGRFVKRKERGAIYLCFDSMKLVRFFEEIGLFQIKCGIPQWIWKDHKFLKACIRGLIDTDGSVFRLSQKDPHIVRISFKNKDKTLLEDLRYALLQLRFHPSQAIHWNISLTRKGDTLRYWREIGFKNPKNRSRFQQFSPVV